MQRFNEGKVMSYDPVHGQMDRKREGRRKSERRRRGSGPGEVTVGSKGCKETQENRDASQLLGGDTKWNKPLTAPGSLRLILQG